MRVITVGAGFSGLSTAKILKSFGHEVTVFEKESDVGGVWNASRRYPGLTTQNTRSTYSFSDFFYPKNFPEWPSGEQVQSYLAGYAKHFELGPHIRFSTEVIHAQPSPDGWTVSTRQNVTGQTQSQRCDYFIVCNGIFSWPLIPKYSGVTDFVAAGGRICHTSQVQKTEEMKDKHVVVVGYGRSACDLAQASCGKAASTRVVARSLIWKVPKRLFNAVNYKYLLLTRLGEGLFKYVKVAGFERFLHGVGKPLRNAMLSQVQWVVTKQCNLQKLNLVPSAPFETIARSTISLVTDGFYESVAAKRIQITRNTEIETLLVKNQKPYVRLTNGETLQADVIICGTGWEQRVPFLPTNILDQLTDQQGNFRLYRSMLPVHVPNLAFNGYNSSLFSPLSCEIGALWLADVMGRGLKLPVATVQDEAITTRLAWMEQRTQGQHARGTNIIPFSLHHIDELLNDLCLPLSPGTRLKQWLLPTSPADYAPATSQLLARYKQVAQTSK